MDADGGRRIFNRLGPSSSSDSNGRQQKVCFHWERGKCTRNPCPFLHGELPTAANGKRGHQGFGAEDNYRGGGGLRRSGNYNFNNSNHNNSWGRPQSQQPVSGNRTFVRKVDKKICSYWLQGSCRYGDTCKFLHQWSTDSFTLLTPLEGHKQAVTGITLPSGSDKLYSGSEDETVRIWDCQSGQLAGVVNMGCSVGCMLSEGPWVFVGLTNLVKAWNIQTSMELSLSGPVGQVYSLVVGNDLLFAGNKDGSILAWKFNAATNCFEPAASLLGHTLAVVTLVVSGNKMYSGSMDHTIRVWSLETMQCIQTLTGHNHVVTSVLCWDQFLLSASLDNTVKVWAATEAGNLEVTYTHTEEQGLITLCGMHDSESKPVLLCSCNDNSVRVYDLPSFSERGKIFSKEEVRSIQIGPGGLFFTGDGSGQVRVWKWSAESTATS
ncbi:zinc finger CCCH domain-containing protein 48-like [Salvia splendens]|uniref:zinc finger CCCH domain-containing protein 48-like n=1 Tax=Salvia splendens TaxID=180675 RepID=UPI001C2740BE|nr:zinc finger CCCH domain-containing protein 48-like [Salvia splendens]